jgi:hypothetical protein
MFRLFVGEGEAMRDTTDMAREADFSVGDKFATGSLDDLKHLVALVRADERNRTWTQEHWTEYERSIVAAEREACADKTGEFARKWWSIHCDSNKHMETTRKAHDDFCALQAAIRARGNT